MASGHEGTQLAPVGRAYIHLKIRGAIRRQVEAVYEMAHEDRARDINGVVVADPGEEV